MKNPSGGEPCAVSSGWYAHNLVENGEAIKKGSFECLLRGGFPMEFGSGLVSGQPLPPQGKF